MTRNKIVTGGDQASPDGGSAQGRSNAIGRLRSRQAGHPSGFLGRIIGRAMVKDTAHANDRAVELLELAEPSTVLDIGFGQGRNTQRLLAESHRVLGVEVSVTMAKQAIARNRSAQRDGRAQLKLGDGVTMPFDDESADAAVTAHTIYFMDDPQATLSDTARVLRPGGRLVIACRVSDDAIPAWIDHDVYRIPSASHVESMLTSAGFSHVVHHRGDESTLWVHWFVADL